MYNVIVVRALILPIPSVIMVNIRLVEVHYFTVTVHCFNAEKLHNLIIIFRAVMDRIIITDPVLQPVTCYILHIFLTMSCRLYFAGTHYIYGDRSTIIRLK